MALNQVFHQPPGRTHLAARLEQPVEPGQPRLFWDGAAGAWSPDPRARLAVAEDPTQPGLYMACIPTAQTAAWPTKAYWLTVLNASPMAGEDPVVDHWGVWIQGGDDGANACPSADVVQPDGSKLHVFGAYRKK